MLIQMTVVAALFLTTCLMGAPIRVACIGDSITQGNANADVERNAWPAILQRMLDAHTPGRWLVGNFGRSGTTALRAGGRSWWDTPEHDAAIEFSPDIAIVNLGTNDASPRHAAIFEGFQTDYADLIDMLQALPSRPAVHLSTLTPAMAPWGGLESSGDRRATVGRVVALEAAARGLQVIDFMTPLEGRADLLPDGIHPVSGGNALMAAAAFEALTNETPAADATLFPVPVRSAPRHMVQAGRPVAVQGEPWTSDGGVLTSIGQGRRLESGFTPGAGPFHMRATLRMRNQDNSAAAFHLGNDVFGFEGAAGRVFRNGPSVGGLRLLHPSEVLFEADTPIAFEVVRNGDQVWMLINGQVADMWLVEGPIESMAFDPMRSTMEVTDWSIAGSVQERRLAHWDSRTTQVPWTDFAATRTPVTSVGQLGAPGAPPEAPLDLPVLRGKAHAAHVLSDGRVMIAFQDTYEGSPTEGDGVLWCGSLDDLLAREEGDWTTRLIPAHRLGVGAEASSISVNGDVIEVAMQHGGHVTRTAFTMDELVSLVPTPDWSLPLADLDTVEEVQVVVDREEGQYLGHPTTVLLEDGQTMLCVYPKGHGRGGIVYKRSTDGGQTWSDRLDVPENWATSREVPTIHRVIDPRDGTKRLIMWSGLYPARLAVSEDDGESWSELAPVGDWGGIVVMGFVERLADGRYMAMFHDDGRFFSEQGRGSGPVEFTLYKTFSHDGGLTWSKPEGVWSGSDIHLCEPGCIRSPDGSKMAILLRENARRTNSHVMFSSDEGATFTPPRELPAALTGDRHTGRYLPDGRLFISFRDTSHESATKGDWVGWVGTWDDIVEGRPGAYRVRLKDNKKGGDCAYPGVELLPDGTIVTTTYGHWDEGHQPYIRTVRVRPERLDALAGVETP
ncbi:MAG: GDSL-type esterase/lipase family protein [Phycisphaerales bacterium]|nr:GDSL-type esterase/lipase family protein [Phycisphaerales bacterium]